MRYAFALLLLGCVNEVEPVCVPCPGDCLMWCANDEGFPLVVTQCSVEGGPCSMFPTTHPTCVCDP